VCRLRRFCRAPSSPEYCRWAASVRSTLFSKKKLTERIICSQLYVWTLT
jgi:hypothetical protein